MGLGVAEKSLIGSELNLDDRALHWSQSSGSYDFVQQYLRSEKLDQLVIPRWKIGFGRHRRVKKFGFPDLW